MARVLVSSGGLSPSQGLPAAVGRAGGPHAPPALPHQREAEPGLQQQLTPSERHKLTPLPCPWCSKGKETEEGVMPAPKAGVWG